MDCKRKLEAFMDEAYGSGSKHPEKKGYGKSAERKKDAKKIRRKKDKKACKDMDESRGSIGKTKKILDVARRGLEKELEDWSDDIGIDILKKFTPQDDVRIKKKVKLDNDMTGMVSIEVSGNFDVAKVKKALAKYNASDVSLVGLGKNKVAIAKIPVDLMEE